MVRRSIALTLGLVLSFVATAAPMAAAQPRQPRVRPTDETGTATTTTDTPPLTTRDPAVEATPPVDENVSATATATTSGDASAAGETDGRDADDTDDPDDAGDAADAHPRIRQHDFGFGYRGVFFATSGTRYVIHGPTVAYTYFVGRRWGFMLHGEASFPVGGHMNGDAGTYSQSLVAQYEQRRYTFDGLFMAARRFQLSPSLVLTAAFGLHVQSFELKSVEYLPVEAITGGFGGLARLEWLASDHVSIGAILMTGIDPLDFIRHEDRVVLTMPFSATVSLGLRY